MNIINKGKNNEIRNKYSLFISKLKDFIKQAFIGTYGQCDYCKRIECKFRKTFLIDNVNFDKYHGLTFNFFNMKVEYLNEYLELFNEFYKKYMKIKL